jgi:subtilisin-like proprotein convertase family protein
MLTICCLGSFALTAQTFSTTAGGPIEDDADDNSGLFEMFTIEVSGEGVLGAELMPSVTFDITHSWVSDLELQITSPAGTNLILTTGGGGNGDDVTGTWSDAGFGPAVNAPSGALDGSYTPEGGTFLQTFGGETIAGTWTILVQDQGFGDAGTFNSGSITFSAPPGDPFATNMQEVNVAGISGLNLTLNDDCQGLLTAEMVLTGDFDVDGDGEVVSSDAFDIVVMDGNPANGPIVDGCGAFQYRVTTVDAVQLNSTITNGFTGDFDPAGGNINTTVGEFATATFSADGSELVLTTMAEESDFFTPTDDATVDVQFVDAGFVSFSYDVEIIGSNNFNDVALVDFEGNTLFQLPEDGGQFNGDGNEFAEFAEGKIMTLAVEAGNTLSFILEGDNEISSTESTFTISEFSFIIPPVMTPLEVIGFTTTWGIVNAEDKTAPSIDGTPDDIDLLCVDLDDNNISTLATDVSHCYRVNAQTGNIVSGTMASALRALLLARTASPVVPVFTDGCSQELEVCVSDDVVYGADAACDDVVITRTFVATEVSTCVSAAGEGNPSVSTSYTITFDSPTLDDLDEDSFDAVVEIESCGADASVRPAPSAADYPTLVVGTRTFNLEVGATICNIGVTYSDGPSIATCSNTFKFVRTYTVIDWCAPNDIRTFTQVVKVGDTTAPTFTGPNAATAADPNFTSPNVATDADGTLVYGTNAGNICVSYIRLDDISVVDSCPGTVSISAQIFPNGNLTGAPIGTFAVIPGGAPELSSAIPVGTHILRYTYSDVCGNTGTTDLDFRVEDQTPPVAICEDGLNFSVAGGSDNGFAVLTPANIDAGSYDDCSGVTLAIARVNANDLAIGGYGPQITLTCADLGIVRVGLRVTDAVGNVNFCWLDVVLEDKLTPSCIAPANTTISCVDFNASLASDITESTDAELDALFGQAAGVDNCETTITQTVSGTINNCGVGSITRTFTSTDGVGFTNTNLCVQTILILGVHDYRITFPTDESGDCMEIPSYVGVSAEELGCDLITTTTDVDTLRTQLAGEECFKLRVTYDVVNWCEYNSLGEPYIVQRNAPGARERTRNPRDIEADLLYVNVIPGATTTMTSDDVAFYSLIDNRTFDPITSERDQEYAGYAASDSRGFFRYTQFIRVYDEVAPEIAFTPLAECFAGSGEGCRTTVTLEFAATDACSDALATIELDANFTGGFVADNPAALGVGVSLTNDGEGNHTVTATNVPVGAHAIRVRASDGCGNVDVQIIEFCVTADRTPTPICIQTLTVALMNDGNGGGIAAIWASDFIASPIVDCFGNVVDKYSLYRSSEAGAAGFVPVSGVVGINDIDCADFDNGTVSVRVYAFDENGTTPDYCEVIVEVQDNMGHCEGSTGNLSGLIATQNDEALEGVEVTLTGANGMDELSMTNAGGDFEFTSLPLGGDYTVQPAFARAFEATEVKSSDVVTMIGVILGTTSFDNAYDFIAADVNRDMDLNVFDAIATTQRILGLEDGFAGGNWVFVTESTEVNVANPYGAAFPEVYNVNDLEGSLRSVSFVAIRLGDVRNGTGRTAQILNVEDAQLEAGQTYTMEFNGSELSAFQGTIELAAGLELVSADYTGEGAINLNNAAEGMIAVALRNNASLTLEVRATAAVTLSEQVSLTDAITVREGVTSNGVSNGLELSFTGTSFELANSLEQNAPNPVADVTTITYTLATAGKATLNIQDVQGRTIMVRELEGVAGRNVTTVNVSELGGTVGIFSYTLTAGNFSATKKMVVVR